MAEMLSTQQTDAAKFWETARQRLLSSNEEVESDEPLDFTGDRFPVDPSGKYFHGLPFRHDVSFADAAFACFNPFDGCEFWNGVDWTGCQLFGEDDRFLFARCKFMSAGDFRDCQFPQRVEFRGVVFEDEVDFGGQQIVEIRFEPDDHADGDVPCRFKGTAVFDDAVLGSISFDGVVFERDASFTSTRFTFWPHFRDAVFRGNADFTRARFERLSEEEREAKSASEVARNRADFVRCTFEYNAAFRGAEFQCDAEFSDARFARDVVFDGARIHRAMHFRCKCDGGGDVRVAGLWINAEREGESIYRAAKNSAHARGDSRAEGEYHFREQCAANAKDRQESKLFKWPWLQDSLVRAWGSFIFGRGVYGYGEKPERVIVAGLIVIALWAVLYDILDAAGDAASSFGTYLYFSVVTFTTLGYGDLQPTPGLARLLAGTEALLGAALMALFVVALTRKYTR